MEKYKHTTAIHNKRSPKVIVPKIISLLQPKNVVDVGCGTGTFLTVFQENGITDILGLEGDWLNRQMLEVDEKAIIITDLEKTFSYNRRFDLAVCLEVVEHLHQNSADNIINTLTGLSDIILFSAAVPGQTGQNHINEQWPAYWQQLFAKKGYFFYDELRKDLWNHPDVDWWYKQNIFIVIKKGSNRFGFEENQTIYDYIHPGLLLDSREVFDNLVKGKMGAAIYFNALKKKALMKLGLISKTPFIDNFPNVDRALNCSPK
jgi:SAM-dependent methyltransferase